MSFVNERISKRIEELAIQLTNIFSVVDTKGEIDISERFMKLWEIFHISKKTQKTYSMLVQMIH